MMGYFETKVAGRGGHPSRWRKRGRPSAEGQEIYHERGATIETINADLKTWRALDRLLVRGKRKVLCVLLLNALNVTLPARAGKDCSSAR